MVTNVITNEGDSLLEVSGNTFQIRRRIQSGKPCGDGYLTIMQPAQADENTHFPAQSIITYIRGVEQARLLAQAFTELADAIDKHKCPLDKS